MKLAALSKDDRILGGVSLLLALDLLFLPWFSVSSGPLSFTLTATDSPDGWLGVLAVLAAVALIVDLCVERLAPEVTVPAIGGSRGQTRFVLAAAAAVFVALKFLFNIHFSPFGFGFWVAVILTAALVYAAVQTRAGAPVIHSR
ncbi:MAG: hypothetical protein ACRDMX_06740 [Solirubrobacteraceae bacterium]